MSARECENMTDEELAAQPRPVLVAWANELTLDVQLIQSQFTVPDRRNADGTVMKKKELHAWRGRASVALAYKQNVLRRVKAALRGANDTAFDEKCGALRPHARALLRELRALDLSGPEFSLVRSRMLKLAEVAFNEDELGHLREWLGGPVAVGGNYEG